MTATQQADDETTAYEDGRTEVAKKDNSWNGRSGIDANVQCKPTPLTQMGKSTIRAAMFMVRRGLRAMSIPKRRVRFGTKTRVATFVQSEAATVFVTYDSGADGDYISEADREKAGWPILRHSTSTVNVANGGHSKGKYVTRVPISGLSNKAAEADTFDSFPHYLISVGKTNDDGNISIFTKTGFTVHKEEDDLITCKGAPIMIGKRDDRGQYRVPLIQQKGQWHPRLPTKRATKKLSEANSVYDLPSTEQAIKWMHAVCGYPVKST